MKVILLTALYAAVTTAKYVERKKADVQQTWWWQVGKIHRYEVESHNLVSFPEGASSGNAFKAKFIVRVMSSNHLQAKIENAQHAEIHQDIMNKKHLPPNLKYSPIRNLDVPFEIILDGGRIKMLNVPSSLTLNHENLLKAHASALQVDLSRHENFHDTYESYDNQTQQGMFRKTETDITGDCQTLYTVSPVTAEWRREVPDLNEYEDAIEITKTKNFGHCHRRADYHFGVPEGLIWSGNVHSSREDYLIKRSMITKILVGKQGPIYKTETTDKTYVSPHIYGKQKGEVISYIKLRLVSYEDDKEGEWNLAENKREMLSPMYTMTKQEVTYNEYRSSESEEYETMTKPYIHSTDGKLMKKFNDFSNYDRSSNADLSSNEQPEYATLYLIPEADNSETPNKVRNLVKNLSLQLQDFDELPKNDFLTLFNILSRVIASMSFEQLTETSRDFELEGKSDNITKMHMWMIYRDAVTQAGTLISFQQIKSWIKSKKIYGEEAAEILTTMITTLKYPTKQMMIQFFELAFDPEVRDQEYLNTTALLAAVKWINLGFIDRENAHSQYPVNMYSHLVPKSDRFVDNLILPVLKKELETAIKLKDIHKSQVYIKSIGILGHPAMLEIFAPYLEGEVKVTEYLRSEMVESLRVLAHTRDNKARTVLYRILKNTAEPHTVRVAAIENIFMTRPSYLMMESMAQMTHDDPDIHVRAALKSAILSAANLKDSRYSDLATSAKATVEMITSEDLSAFYSIKLFKDLIRDEDDSGFMKIFSKTASKNSILPDKLRLSMKSTYQGMNKEYSVSASSSNIQDLIDQFIQTISSEKEAMPTTGTKHRYSADKVARMLNIITNQKTPLEASFYIDHINHHRFFAFGGNDVREFGNKLISLMQKGIHVHYNKVFNQAQILVVFPLATGMPFVYRYNEPTLVHLQANGKSVTDYKTREKYFTGKVESEISLVFARNIDGNVGYFDTISERYASTGVVSKVQMNLPIKIYAEKKKSEVEFSLEALSDEKYSPLLHYSVWPYTAVQNKHSLIPVSHETNTKLIMKNKKTVSIDYKIGRRLGVQMHLEGYSYSSDYYMNIDSINDESCEDIFTGFYQKDMALTHFNFRYLEKESKNKKLTFTAAYDRYYNQIESQQKFTPMPVKDIEPNSSKRREELSKHVSSGIYGATAQVLDMSLTFYGPERIDFIATGAIANSPVDSKMQYALFAAVNSIDCGNHQINGVATVTKPNITAIDFSNVFSKDFKTTFDAEIMLGAEGEKIRFQSLAERTKGYAEKLKKTPPAKQCIKDMMQHNYYQNACHKILTMAHVADHLKAVLIFENVDLPYFGLILPHGKNPSNEIKFDMDIQADYAGKLLKLNTFSSYGNFSTNFDEINEALPMALSLYAPLKPYERVANYFTNEQYQPYCTVDHSRIKTFSNRTYDFIASPAWQVVLLDSESKDQLVLLVRRPSEKQQELYMSYRSINGKEVEMIIKPSHPKFDVQVSTNAKKVYEGELVMYSDDLMNTPFLEYYTDKDAVIFVQVADKKLRFMYDGNTLVVFPEVSRGKVNGLCGRMSGDPMDDYITPYGIVDRPDVYAATYTLNEDIVDQKVQELQKVAKVTAYTKVVKPTKISASVDNKRREDKSNIVQASNFDKVYMTRNFMNRRGPCQLQKQVQYYETYDDICISTEEIPSCQGRCKSDGFRVQAVMVVCKPKSDSQFKMYRDQIQQGLSPSVIGTPEAMLFRVPSVCN